jgi:hypothetical protein
VTAAADGDAAAGGDVGGGPSARWLCGGAAALAVGLFWLVHRALIDDAYITLGYARNLATDLHWGMISTETANAATSPLNVLLLGGVTALFRLGGEVRPIWGLGAVSVGAAVALAWWWTRVAEALRLPLPVPALGVALVLLNPFVLSATGLEVLLVAAVLVGLLAEAIGGRPTAFGVLAGLAVLTRLDLAVFVLPLALASAGVRRRWPRTAGVSLAVGLPWYAWSWWYFGSAIPDTFAIKTLQKAFGRWTFGNGLLGFLEFAPWRLVTAVSVIPAALGLAALLGWAISGVLRRKSPPSELVPPAALGAAGVAYYGAYALLGVPPYHWYYVPTLVALSTCLCVLLGVALRGSRLLCRAVGVPGLALVACLAAASLAVDVRGGVPRREPIFFGNWATPGDYARIGRQLGGRVGPATVISPGEIGALAYYCECSLVDAFADRGRAVPLIEERIAAAGPVMGALLRLNYLWLDRDVQPRRAHYQLVWTPGPATGPEHWQTWSPAAGVGHLWLEALPAS